MMQTGKYIAHNVLRSEAPDGSVRLTSGLEMPAVAHRVGDWLDHWAAATPEAPFLAERSGAGWRKLGFAEVRARVRGLAAGLLGLGLTAQTPILIISGNSIDHALLALAAQYVGIPFVPLAEQYSLIPGAQPQLIYCAELVQPGLVFADDGAKYGAALGLDLFADVPKLVSRNAAAGMRLLDELTVEGDPDSAVQGAVKNVGPDTVAKYLMTSGSTSHPKGVITTHGMLTTNQAQIAACLPFLTARPPVIVDWLPWNHTFGGSYTFNMMLAHGGTLYIDAGKPVKALVGQTVENLRLQTGTIAFNVPVGFALLRDVMRADKTLRRRYFENLDMLFYAGASLPQDVWQDLADMAMEVRGDMPLFTSSWGMTETAPGCLLGYEPATRSGQIGVPMPGIEIKLLPQDDDAGRYELRCKGANNTPGYLKNPEQTAELFDEEGFLRSGDAVKLIDPDNPGAGLRFDGRISEDFKLITGTWVRAANLRLSVLQKLAGLAQDVVICGADRAEIGLMVVPLPDVMAALGAEAVESGAVTDADLLARIADALQPEAGQGSSTRIARALVLAEPPQMGAGEITAKGNLNFRKLLVRRAGLLDRLYSDDDPAVARI